jgi:hypothetical protein
MKNVCRRPGLCVSWRKISIALEIPRRGFDCYRWLRQVSLAGLSPDLPIQFVEMRKLIVAIFVSVTVVALSQDRGPGIVLRPSGPAPHWDKGVVEGRTYKNASVGLELTPAPALEFGTPELKGNPGTVPLLVTITAAGEAKLVSAREVMSFYSDAMAYYPENRRSTADYMRRVVLGNGKEGFTTLGGTSESKLGGVTFARQDFQKGFVYEGVLVKACKTEALVFIFGAPDLDTVNKLVAATQLKLDSATSGCSPAPTSPVQR